MSSIPQYSSVNAPFVDPQTGILSYAANVWLRDLWNRTGGATAPSNNDLATTEYADAGIEENKAATYALADQLNAFDVSGLLATIAELAKRVEALEQGTVI